MVSRSALPFTFDVSGGELCLDFANTVDNRYDSNRRTERLPAYDDFVSWCLQVGLIDDRAHREFLAAARADPKRADGVLRQVVVLRDATHHVFAAAAQGRAAPPRALQILNTALRDTLAHADIVRDGRTYRWTWQPDKPNRLDHPLRPIVKSAADLLTSDRLGTVRLCAAPACGWLFLDTSRNQSRRWCDMKVCGNREKARRFRSGLRQSATIPA